MDGDVLNDNVFSGVAISTEEPELRPAMGSVTGRSIE
jgi:hypothetical protein